MDIGDQKGGVYERQHSHPRELSSSGPLQRQIPKPGIASFVWWGLATSKHPKRAPPWLTGSQESPMQGQRKGWYGLGEPCFHLFSDICYLYNKLGTQGHSHIRKIGSCHADGKATGIQGSPAHPEFTFMSSTLGKCRHNAPKDNRPIPTALGMTCPLLYISGT